MFDYVYVHHIFYKLICKKVKALVLLIRMCNNFSITVIFMLSNNFNVTFCMSIWSFCSGTDGSNNSYSTHLTRSEFTVPARDIAYTNITHIVILLIYVVFPKVKIVYFCNQCTFVRQEQLSHNAYGITLIN